MSHSLAGVVVLESGFEALAYGVVILPWFLSFVAEGLIIRSGGERSTEVRADRRSGVLILVGPFGSIFIANAFSRSGLAPLPVASFHLGLAMMLLGTAFRFWAVAALRSFFS